MSGPTPRAAPEPRRAALAWAGEQLGLARVELVDPTAAPAPGRAIPPTPAGGVLFTTERLADPSDPTLDAALALTARLAGIRDERVLATWLQGWIAWWALGPIVAVWLREGRAISLSSVGVAVRWDGTAASAAIPDGPWHEDPGRDGDALHEGLVRALEPMVAAFAARRRVGVRQQWLQTADRLAAALQVAARADGRETAAVPAARALLDRPGSPLRSARAGFTLLGPPDARALTWVRGTCCLAWRAPAGELCPTCPAAPAPAPGGTAPGRRPAAAPG